MPKQLQFTTNQIYPAQTRHETVDGVEYLVVPSVVIQFNTAEASEPAAVLNDELLTMSQFCPFTDKWEGVLVPLGHPQVNGEFVSVHSNEKFEAESPAVFKNVHCKNNALQGEFWINVNKANQIGGDALIALRKFEAGEVVNVSTAYFRNITQASGVFNGKSYETIASNIEPDHVAILLHQDGACSVDDGCGVPRVNNDEGAKEMPKKQVAINIELSLTEQDEKVWNAWYDQGRQHGWIFKVLTDHVIATGPSQLWIVPYEISEDGGVTFGQPIEAEIVPMGEVTTNRNLFKSFMDNLKRYVGNSKEIQMDRQKLIEGLVANERCQLSAETLEKFGDEELQALQQTLVEPEPDDKPEAKAETPDPEPKPEPEQAGEGDAVVQLRQDIAQLTKVVDGLTQVVKPIQENAQAQKDKMVAELVGNQRCKLNEAELKAMDLDTLTRLSESLQPQANYAGRSAGQAIAYNSEGPQLVGEMGMPVVFETQTEGGA